MKKFASFMALVLSASLALNSCDSATNTVNIKLSDSALTPITLTAQAGMQVTFKVKNNGKAPYDCDLRDLSTITSLPSQFYWGLNQIPAGSTKTGTFHAPTKPASFQVACGVSPFDPVTTGTSKALLATLVVK